MAKQKKLSRKELEKAAAKLPVKDRATILEEEVTLEWLEEQIKFRKGLMKRDVFIGLPWFVVYTASLFMFGMTSATIAIFVVGMVYFIYTIFTTGSYGDNKKRIGVYEELLQKLR